MELEVKNRGWEPGAEAGIGIGSVVTLSLSAPPPQLDLTTISRSLEKLGII